MQRLYRGIALAVADREVVRRIAGEGRLGRRLVRRFIAGETLAEALAAARAIARQGMTITLDQLGESVEDAASVRAARDTAIDSLEELHRAGLEPNISIKLTMFGLDLDEQAAVEQVAAVVAVADRVGGFVRIDMEGSDYTERTITITERLHDRFPGAIGTVIQSYLYRSPEDVERLLRRGIRIRLVKGAYAEPATVAYTNGDDIDAAYGTLMRRLLDAGSYPALATHDPALIAAARAHAKRHEIAPDRFEFQMLYGVRRDAQAALTRQGYRVRVYVPYGTEWYAYFSRRIAERPGNALFVARQLLDDLPRPGGRGDGRGFIRA
ncbi:MAG: proline dehydrogenase family protein [Chloroflexota bacterium]|nr:proline dehydrogenase family protein [Chloroflexota bacterium]